MERASVVVFVVDRLSARFLGPYGNTWSETRAVNELAAQSILAEHAITDSSDLPTAYRSLWSGLHAVEPDRQVPSLVSLARDHGLPTTLLTDAPEIERLAVQEPFEQRVLLTDDPHVQTAHDVGDTLFARLVATALDLLHETSEPGLLWVHAQGMSGPWDAPHRFRERLVDDEDPDPPTWVHPPSEVFDGVADPDHLLGLATAYAAQVRVIDDCLVPFLAQLGKDRFRDMFFLWTSPRGYPLGEHGVVGNAAPCPFSESFHVPLLVRFPGADFAAQRFQTIVQPVDVFATVCEALNVEAGNHGLGKTLTTLNTSESSRVALSLAPSAASGADDGESSGLALRTQAWHYCVADGSPNAGGEPVERLYAKPDDIWEVNDVADLCPDVLVKMKQLVSSFRESANEGRLQSLPPLDEQLSAGHW